MTFKQTPWQNIKPTIEKVKKIHPDFHLSKFLNQPEPCKETKEKLFGIEPTFPEDFYQKEYSDKPLNYGCGKRIDPSKFDKKNEEELIVVLPDSNIYGLTSV